jgi:DNA (cytosine-5)-methyltransferase 1
MAEIEAFPRAVLEQRHGAIDARRSSMPRWAPMLWGDFTTIKERYLRRLGRSLADIDVLVGGTPCQSFSIAGLRGSLGDDRGNLALSFVRIANAIDRVRLSIGLPPVWVVWENVPGVLSTHDNAFGCVLAGLVGGDAPLDPSGRGGWTDAGVVAGPKRCAAWRVLDAQHFGLAQRRRRVFVVARGYFGEAGRWDGPDALLPILEGRGWHSAPGRDAGEGVAGSLAASAGGGDENDATDGRLVAHTLNAKGGGGRIDAESETFIPVAFAENSRAELRLEGGDGQTVAALKTGGGKPGQSYPAIAFHARQDPDSGPVTHPLDTDGSSIGVMNPMGVRHLTPRECERLQGFPDDFSAITVNGQRAKDEPRYKALGNSMAVPVMAWIGARIAAVHAVPRMKRAAALADLAALMGLSPSATIALPTVIDMWAFKIGFMSSDAIISEATISEPLRTDLARACVKFSGRDDAGNGRAA